MLPLWEKLSALQQRGKARIWVLSVLGVTAVDLLIRNKHLSPWEWREWGGYIMSVIYVLGWLVLWRAVLPHIKNRSVWAWRGTLLGLGVFSSIMYLGSYAYMIYFGVMPNVITASYSIREPAEAWRTVLDALRLALVLVFVLLVGVMSLNWWAGLKGQPQLVAQPRRRWKLWSTVGMVAVLTPAFHLNVSMSEGNFLPPVNLVFSFSKSAEYWMQNESDFRRLQVGNRIPLPTVGTQPPVNVLLIINESLGASHTHFLGYHRPTTPEQEHFFQRHPQQVFAFPRFYATSSITSESVPTITTGVHAMEPFSKTHRMPLIHEYGKMYGNTRTFHYSAHSYVNANYRYFFQSEKLDELTYLEKSGFPQFNGVGIEGRHVSEQFVQFLDKNPQTPFLGVLHYNDTHYPYHVPPAWELWGKESQGFKIEGDPNLYDNSIAYSDHNIGTVLDALEKRGLMANTVVVVTSDHGEGFGEHGVYGHLRSFYDEFIHVPFWLYLPPNLAQRYGKTIRDNLGHNWANLDIVPTLTDILELNQPGRADTVLAQLKGRSLLRHYTQDRPIWVQNGNTTSRLTDGFALLDDKVVVTYQQIGVHLGMAYFDMAQDPGQRINLWGRLTPEQAQRVAQKLQTYPEMYRQVAGQLSLMAKH